MEKFLFNKGPQLSRFNMPTVIYNDSKLIVEITIVAIESSGKLLLQT